MVNKYKILLIIAILLGIYGVGLLYYQYNNQTQKKGLGQYYTTSGYEGICLGIKDIYERGMFDSEIQKCDNNKGEQYFMIQRYGIEGGSGKDFFDITGNKIGSISQYGAGDGTIPDKPVIEGETFNGSCDMVNLKDCGIIDLSHSYRGPKGLLKDSEYAKTCKNTLQKLGLEPPKEFTEEFYKLGNRYFMCTDDKTIFYLSFTGNKIGNDASAEYNNYNIIELYSMQGETLGLSKHFGFKFNSSPFRGINIKESISEISSINRCIPMPTYDCYESQ